MKTKRLVFTLVISAFVFILVSSEYADAALNQTSLKRFSLSSRPESSLLIAEEQWDWPWASPQYPFCFAVKQDYDYIYRTLYGRDSRDAGRKVSSETSFMHSGVCQCEGRSATEYPPTCNEPSE